LAFAPAGQQNRLLDGSDSPESESEIISGVPCVAFGQGTLRRRLGRLRLRGRRYYTRPCQTEKKAGLTGNGSLLSRPLQAENRGPRDTRAATLEIGTPDRQCAAIRRDVCSATDGGPGPPPAVVTDEHFCAGLGLEVDELRDPRRETVQRVSGRGRGPSRGGQPTPSPRGVWA